MNKMLFLLYVLPVAGIFVWYLWSGRKKERKSLQAAADAVAASMDEPPSLHPVIDPLKCIGCRSCVAVCPEQKSHAVLGIIRGKAHLIEPANCIGHGACKTACPVDAIQLVFGTERRGIDIPVVDTNFESDVPGVFIAGELGGMGLIGNAIEQGKQAIDSVKKLDGLGSNDSYDVIIVGAGPAGFSASLEALRSKLRFLTLEQDTLGGTVAHYPRGKLVMTRPAILPIVGKMRFKETTKEELMEFWQGVERKTQVKINYSERVTAVTADPNGKKFIVSTSNGKYPTRAVLLTIGRRGTPRQLGVPGEELPKVVYRVIDPEQYCGQHVLVVGGGDSALEAAHSIAEQHGATVTLSYRSSAFTRAKAKNRDKVAEMSNAGQLSVLFNSSVSEVFGDSVVIKVGEKETRIRNDVVVVSAGGILPNGFLKEIGVTVETKFGTA